MLFSETAGRLFEPAAGGRVPTRAEKSIRAREAEGQAAGRGSFGTFLAAKKSTRKNIKVSKINFILDYPVKPGNDENGCDRTRKMPCGQNARL